MDTVPAIIVPNRKPHVPSPEETQPFQVTFQPAQLESDNIIKETQQVNDIVENQLPSIAPLYPYANLNVLNVDQVPDSIPEQLEESDEDSDEDEGMTHEKFFAQMDPRIRGLIREEAFRRLPVEFLRRVPRYLYTKFTEQMAEGMIRRHKYVEKAKEFAKPFIPEFATEEVELDINNFPTDITGISLLSSLKEQPVELVEPAPLPEPVVKSKKKEPIVPNVEQVLPSQILGIKGRVKQVSEKESLVHYSALEKSPGESNFVYDLRIRLYNQLLKSGKSKELADMLSRMKINVEMLSVSYAKPAMDELNTLVPSL